MQAEGLAGECLHARFQGRQTVGDSSGAVFLHIGRLDERHVVMIGGTELGMGTSTLTQECELQDTLVVSGYFMSFNAAPNETFELDLVEAGIGPCSGDQGLCQIAAPSR